MPDVTSHQPLAGLAAAISGILSPQSQRHPRMVSAAALSLAFAFTHPCVAGTYTVTTTGDPGPSDTISLREAVVLANADPGSTVQFAANLQGSTITLTQGAIAPTQPVYIQGPGAAKLTVHSTAVTPVFYVNAVLPTFEYINISGLTLSTEGGAAAVVYTYNTPVNLSNCVVTGTASNGVLVRDNSPGLSHYVTLENVTIQGVSGTGLNVIGFNSGKVFVNDSTITQNTDGGISANSADFLRLINTRVTNNTSTFDGGGIISYASGIRLIDSQVTGNYSAANGGGISLGDAAASPTGFLDLMDSEVSGNQAYYYGGGIFVYRTGQFAAQRALISGNSTIANGHGNGGGGLWLVNLTQPSYLDNSTIYGNHAYYKAGGIGIVKAATANILSIVNSTIVANGTSYYSSNGIFVAAGQPYIGSSIVANNVSRLYSQDMAGAFVVNYSLIKNPTGAAIIPAVNIFGVDPSLGPLASNGGSTRTLLPSPASPVLNAGNAATSTGMDQRGLPRVAGGRVDMGAVERQIPEVEIFRNGFDSS